MAFSLSHYWMHLDQMGKLVALLLVAMSLLSWYTLLSKSWTFWRIRRSASCLTAFWNAPHLEDAQLLLVYSDVEKIFTPLAIQSLQAVQDHTNGKSLMTKTDLPDVISRVLRQEMNQVTIRLESGLTLLASIGATAPFVGLLGTVWGIYGALNAISGEGTIQLDIVAGPVGEALVMTAMGLLVAIPSVLAYNAFNRINRITLAELDGFAFDLHAYLSKANNSKVE